MYCSFFYWIFSNVLFYLFDDAGKTVILDNRRRTHVQAKEADGITQQIGATNVPLETIYERTKMCREIIT